MTSLLQVEALSPMGLGPFERACWRAWTAADPRCDSPYFHLDYIQTAAEFAPGGALALLKRRGELVGFLPYQRRGAEVHPLGAPLTDYHGPILKPGAEVDLGEAIRRLEAEVFSFTGLVYSGRCEGPVLQRDGMAADLSQGFDAYLADRRAANPHFWRERRRTEAALRRDHEVEFSFGPGDETVLDWILEKKRQQYRRTGQHDVFACGWTERMLRALVERSGPDLGVRFAVLRTGRQIIAAEMSLVAGATCHLWFPAYDTEFARYSPGMLVTQKTLEVAGQHGLRTVDFGPGGERYKAYFATPSRPVSDGRLIAKPYRISLTRVLAESYASGLGGKLGRRLHVLTACETSVLGWSRGLAMAAAASAASAARVRTPRVALAVATAPALAADVAELAPLI